MFCDALVVWTHWASGKSLLMIVTTHYVMQINWGLDLLLGIFLRYCFVYFLFWWLQSETKTTFMISRGFTSPAVKCETSWIFSTNVLPLNLYTWFWRSNVHVQGRYSQGCVIMLHSTVWIRKLGQQSRLIFTFTVCTAFTSGQPRLATSFLIGSTQMHLGIPHTSVYKTWHKSGLKWV